MLQYKYYDTPDGQDLIKKLFITGKYATLTGLGISSLDVLLYSKPKGYLEALGRYATVTGPLVGMAAVFTIGTYVATNVREKDDYKNYVVGATSAGCLWGALRRSYITAVFSSLAFSLAGVIKKKAIENDYTLFPPPKRHFVGSLWSQKHDFTILKDRPKGWTTGENDKA